MTYEKSIEKLLSVELLSEVLGISISSFEINNNNIEIVTYDKNIDRYGTTIKENIDTFCFKCKEWLEDNGEMFVIQYHSVIKGHKSISIKFYGKDSCFKVTETEQEAIIKATNYIIKRNRGR